MNCPKCNKEIPADSVFCPYCGEKMAEVCSECGAELIAGSAFCRMCGAKIAKSGVPVKTKAEKETPAEKFEWSVLDNGTVIIDKYIGDDEKVVIPSEIDGKKVTKIGKLAFCRLFDDFQITSVTIPDSVTGIGNGAFEGCQLTSITIPDSVTEIGETVFRGCPLVSIKLPNGVTEISNGLFEGCIKLKSITIPESVTYIGTCAFRRCESLKTISIPDNVTKIFAWAFEDCTSLTSINIPDGVEIDEGAFDGTPLADKYK